MIPFRYKHASTSGVASLLVFIDGNPMPIASDAVNFNQILDALKRGDDDAVRAAINIKKAITLYSNGKVTIEQRDGNDEICYDGVPVNAAMNSRMMTLYREGFNFDPLAKFLENLLQNPTEHARDELYLFLDACDLPITEDGCFLAYKVVRSNYTDCHTGKMNNSIGTIVKMDRSACNMNRNQTCSTGLHFCSRTYIEHFRSCNDRLMVVKVNPKDVTSIPSDYNNAKGRACEYVILSELQDDQQIKPNFADTKATVAVSPSDDKADNKTASSASAKLNPDKVRAIRKLFENDNTCPAIAKMYGVNERTIQRIIAGTAWKNVK